MHGFHGAVSHLEHCTAHMTQADLELFDVRSQQGQGGEGGRSDGKALAGSGRGVAEGVQHVGLLTDGRIQFAHLGVAAGIVGNGAVSICGQGDSQGGKHADSRYGNAVEAQAQRVRREHEVGAEAIGQQDGEADGNHRNGRRAHAQADAVDDNGSGAGGGRFGQFLGGAVGMRGVIFGDFADDHAGEKAAEDAQGQFPPIREAQEVKDPEGKDGDEDGGQVGAHGEGFEKILQGGAFLGADGINADDGEHHADGGDHHRGEDGPQLDVGAIGKEGRCAEGHGGEDGAAVTFVQVGAHAGHIAHVVTHVVGDGGGIAGVVLRDVLLHLADDVGPDIGRLGIDTATHTGEEGLRGGAHAEGEHGGGDDDQVLRVAGVIENFEDAPPDGDVQQAQAHHGEPHHGAAAESNPEAGIEAAHGGVGRTRTGVSGCLHTHETGQAAEETAGKESERNPGVLHAESIGQNGKQDGQNHENDDYHLVLLFEIGHGALAHVLRNLFHGRGAFAFLHHLAEEKPGEQQGNHCRHRHQIEQVGHSYWLLVVLRKRERNYTSVAVANSLRKRMSFSK